MRALCGEKSFFHRYSPLILHYCLAKPRPERDNEVNQKSTLHVKFAQHSQIALHKLKKLQTSHSDEFNSQSWDICRDLSAIAQKNGKKKTSEKN